MRLGDLDALKNKIKELPWTGDESYYDRVGLHAITDLIDNAPTVEPEVYMTAKDYNLYLEGYKQGRKDFGRSRGECRTCIHRDPENKKCDCGGLERVGCSFPVSDDYFCKFYEKGGAEE